MMNAVISDLAPEVILTDALCDFDKNLFGVDEMAEDEIKACARSVRNERAFNRRKNVSPSVSCNLTRRGESVVRPR